ncbi:unnamed protein product [Aphanomyces euteiches]|uniref:MSP domain-containing protein n=1 Tax=Aphanomyces euteiches TaxID=100861 RepID=A0A6G0X3G5_9STRA|nr:hypothetical protein Ae201684_008900 [Aphanomyces euteiches]KAH9054444.1 hypothetical protein Ae201684P_018164 [Aphanomyces euteiches]KAH9135189.1 hypothetical protein AeRB84_019295 [Aphanomyces euteiches]
MGNAVPAKVSCSSTRTLAKQPLNVVVNPSARLAFTLVRGLSAMAVLNLTNQSDTHHVAFRVRSTHKRYHIQSGDGILGPRRAMAVAVLVAPEECERWTKESPNEPDTFVIEMTNVPKSVATSTVRWEAIESTAIHAVKMEAQWSSWSHEDDPLV